jgi:hypothetical protein
MVDLDPIPLAGDDDDRPWPTRGPVMPPARPGPSGPPGGVGRPKRSSALAVLLTLALVSAHALAAWRGVGGQEGLSNPWPIWRDDHPLYYHSALVTRAFLRQTGTTAGYDPSFMAGYAKSVVFPASSTLPELVIWAFGADHPAQTYKAYVLLCTAVLPWLLALAARAVGLRPEGVAIATLLFLLYLWTDFPINYAAFGMLPYLLSVPLGLLAVAVFSGFLAQGGLLRWLASAVLLSLSVLVHLTAGMIAAPAAALAYLAAILSARGGGRSGGGADRQGLSAWRHLGVWLIPPVVLISNAFWWLPGLWLASTKGPSDFAFAHSSETVLGRLLQIVTTEAPAESLLIGLGLVGLVLLSRQNPARCAAIGGFGLAGFFWGYLAGGFQALDFLQPGRHTYAFYTAMALAGGLGADALLLRLRAGSVRLDRWAMAAAMLLGLRVFGPSLVDSLRFRLWQGEPFLSSRPSPRLIWVVDRLKAHVKPGERLLYEEGGKDLPGVPDPFQRGRFSGLLPELTGVELLGGPYLHASLTTNFTQFGEGALFGETDWDRDHFVKYARLYRPSAILCWSPRARRFCRSYPDLVEILEDDGVVLIGRVLGFEGDAIVGSAQVKSEPGRLTVSDLTPGVDGTVVLRYHSVPSLKARPAIALETWKGEGDPVPFLSLRPPPGLREVELEMDFPVPVPW